ncbi:MULTISPECIES: sensor histidine kinase [Cellulophaga]|uniref:histidine kinase n=2 Tax=Cellulophaga TaxID=104264 RepID=F0RHC0_CELLC|nr:MULTISPECIES: ATP-binding protein [Cellulophaga]ADY29160.1 integral membrane sensor signal transduction histidine kinase [Cellulophaga lytica DSM 7489]EWH14568.1 integral membrane sensor signal transduction histidine kinase [Cellulophaga geojensis KL-A]MDO6851959.1 ATP-binding protein [Cellulophaga lytica]WQG76665.1 ATP-binding protein [Cellulophaga lytica]
MQKLWFRYRKWYINYIEFEITNTNKGLEYFRDKLFISILLLVNFFGVLAYIPSVIVAYINFEMKLVLINTLAVSVLLFVVFNRSLSLNLKKHIFSGNLLILSTLLFINNGLSGNGALILLMTTSAVTLYSGKKAGFFAFGYAVLMYACVLIFTKLGYYNFVHTTGYNFTEYVIISLNNLLFNLILVFSISFLITQLHKALLNENKLQKELIVKHNNAVAARNKAEQSEQLKSAFLANISHEIGTPMYSILGTTDLLKDYNTEDNGYQKSLQLIEENGNKLLDIIADIVNISKVESGLMPITPTAFNVKTCVEEIYTKLKTEVVEKDIDFTLTNLISTNESLIYTDKEKVEAVLNHLVKNAIKYTEKGSINIKCHLPEEGIVAFEVKDTGIGIPKDKFRSIFKAFYQVDTDQKNALHGSGVGLAISKAYTEMLGGKLSLKNNQDSGSTFGFTICTHWQCPEKKKNLKPAHNQKIKKVLL